MAAIAIVTLIAMAGGAAPGVLGSSLCFSTLKEAIDRPTTRIPPKMAVPPSRIESALCFNARAINAEQAIAPAPHAKLSWFSRDALFAPPNSATNKFVPGRSEERRVGKE